MGRLWIDRIMHCRIPREYSYGAAPGAIFYVSGLDFISAFTSAVFDDGFYLVGNKARAYARKKIKSTWVILFCGLVRL